MRTNSKAIFAISFLVLSGLHLNAWAGLGAKEGSESTSCENLTKSVRPGEIVQVAENVFAGAGKATSGEPVYFGMELVDSTNKRQWQIYAARANFMADSCRGAMTVLAIWSKKHRPYEPKDLEGLGFTEEEYNAYMNRLRERKLDQEKNREPLIGVCGGIAGFDIFDDGNDYVVYVSKKPVTGKFKFPEKPIANLKAFNEDYDDLLMSVRSRMTERDDTYNNRGIFRNPKGFVDGGYSGLAMQLHGFSAAVMRTLFKKEYMTVKALPSMYKIMEKVLGPKDALVGNEVPSEFDSCFPGGFGVMDKPFVIKTEALHRVYQEQKKDPSVSTRSEPKPDAPTEKTFSESSDPSASAAK